MRQIVLAAACFTGIVGGDFLCAQEKAGGPAAPKSSGTVGGLQRRELSSERDAIQKQVEQLQKEGKNAETVDKLQRLVALQKQLFGEKSSEAAEAVRSLADCQMLLRYFEAGRRSLAEFLAIQTALLGKDHWQVLEARLALADAETLAKADEQIQNDWVMANGLLSKALELQKSHKAAEGARFAAKAAQLYTSAAGREHWMRAKAVLVTGQLLTEAGDYEQAEALLESALELYEKILGDRHPSTADALAKLGEVNDRRGSTDKALQQLERSLAIYQETLGPQHLHTIRGMNDMAAVLKSNGDYVAAIPLLEEVLRWREKNLGANHPHNSVVLSSLADVYKGLGDYDKAISLMQRAVKISERSFGEAPPTASALDGLAEIYLLQSDFSKAVPLLDRELRIYEKASDPVPPDIALPLVRLAGIYRLQGDYAKAQPLYERALAIRQRALGADHPQAVSSLEGLAELYQDKKDFTKALPLLERAIAMREKSGAQEHPNLAQTLTRMAYLQQARGDNASAHKAAGRALAIGRNKLERLAAILSQRQLLGMQRDMRGSFDLFLTTGLSSGASAAALYEPVLTWKGAPFVLQSWNLVAGDDETTPATKKLYGELEAKSRTLASAYSKNASSGQHGAYQQKLQLLTGEVEMLQRQLAESSNEFRIAREAARTTVEDLQKSLPAQTALIDIVEYTSYSAPSGASKAPVGQQRMLAFVVRADRPVKAIDLGAAKRIQGAVYLWRMRQLPQEITAEDAASFPDVGAYWKQTYGEDAAPQQKLWEWIWELLEAELEDCPTVLVSPAGALASFPWAAMPGKSANSYLLEERCLVTIPIPQMLPGLLARAPGARVVDPSLLLVADVNYTADPGPFQKQITRLTTGEKLLQPMIKNRIRALLNTRGEVGVIRNLFTKAEPTGPVVMLTDTAPTEEKVRKACTQARYIHMATQGYSRLPTIPTPITKSPIQSSTDSQAPIIQSQVDLLSGITLVGAARPASADKDDGIFTALEVKRLDLRNAEMVTLPACQTSLGMGEAGEGPLTLQRAFALAGVRTTVTSLWSAEEESAGILMTEFYTNLWSKRMPRGEALRQAQIKLLKEGAQLLTYVKKGQEGVRMPPVLWAGFVLSGDWR